MATTIDVVHYNVRAESDFGYSQAIKSGELIHVSGQLSLDETGMFVHDHDVTAQLKQTYADMDKVLDHYTVSRKQVISQTLYVVDLRRNAARRGATADGNLAYFGDHRPVSTVLGISELTFPGQVIEISCIVDTRLPA
ncbi:RidA family protein [Streptomyces cucumeris]|uniref:RidA family protein n=1 Tax=Streptomyces cucumeris TaxID=2962890 RepID=UPI003D73D742